MRRSRILKTSLFLPLCILLFLLMLVCLSNNTGSRCPCIPSNCTSTHPLTLSCLSWNKKRRVRYVMKPGAFSVNLLFEDIFVWYLEIQLLKYFFFFDFHPGFLILGGKLLVMESATTCTIGQTSFHTISLLALFILSFVLRLKLPWQFKRTLDFCSTSTLNLLAALSGLTGAFRASYF